MAVMVGMWTLLSLIFMNSVLYIGYSKAFPESGEWCYWCNDTDYACKMCNLTEDIVDCQNRSLKDVTINGSDQMVGLNVSFNHLRETPLIINCTNLVWIDLSYNTEPRVMNEEAFRNIKSETLRMLNLSNCGLVRVQPVPLKDFIPHLEIFILTNNSLTYMNLSMCHKLVHFRLLDMRNNALAGQSIMPCDLFEQNYSAVILLESTSDCTYGCVQAFFQLNRNLSNLLGNTSKIEKCNYTITSPIPMIEKTSEDSVRCTMLVSSAELPITWLLSTTDNTESITPINNPVGEENEDSTNLRTGMIASTVVPDYFSSIAISSTGTTDTITTEEHSKTVKDVVLMWKLIISGSSVIFIALCLFLILKVKNCLRVKSMQGQYTPWLPGNTVTDHTFYYSQNISYLLNVLPEDECENQRNDRHSQTSAYKVYSQLNFENIEAQDDLTCIDL